MASLAVNRLLVLRNEIHRNIADVRNNRTRCECLCERIDRLIDPLERLEHAPASVLRAESQSVLQRLLQCIDECNHYIEKQNCSQQHADAADEEKFRQLNQELTELGQDLCVALNIQQVFDQRVDLSEITKRLDDIARQMSDKQSEQQQAMSKILDKRLQSFRLNLEQDWLLQPDEQQSFLRIPHKDLHIDDQPMGRGGFADVYQARWLTHHDQVAVKVIRITQLSTARDDFLREISTMYRIRYDNILTVLGACIEPSFYAIVVEYMPLGSLYDVLHRKSEQVAFDWPDRYSLAWQMAKAINYLHNCSPVILHRDIKSANFLLKYNGSSAHKYLLKVCDFGLAEIRRETLLQSAAFPSAPVVGTFYWKAPELLLPRSRHTKESDVYSLGVVCWELATGRKPWDEFDDETVILIQVKMGERPTIPTDVPEPYQQIIRKSWEQDPLKRPSCFQLMEEIVLEMNHGATCVDPLPSLTRTAEHVAEKEKSMSSIPDSGISQSSTLETTTTDAVESSSNPVEDYEQLSERSIPLSQPAGFLPIYKLEKRRPLHRKYLSKPANQ